MIILERDGSRLRHTPVVPANSPTQSQNVRGCYLWHWISPPARSKSLFFFTNILHKVENAREKEENAPCCRRHNRAFAQ